MNRESERKTFKSDEEVKVMHDFSIEVVSLKRGRVLLFMELASEDEDDNFGDKDHY